MKLNTVDWFFSFLIGILFNLISQLIVCVERERESGEWWYVCGFRFAFRSRCGELVSELSFGFQNCFVK